MATAFAMPAHAVDWLFNPYVGGSAIYTDNVNQSPTNEENALILTLTPGFTLQSKGSRRIQATIQYGLSGVARFGGNNDNNLYHNLSASGKAELVEDFLFLDGNAQVSQQLISLLGSPADATINDSNRATTGSYSISPNIKKRFGTFADAEARYTLSGTLFGQNVLSDLLTNTFSASLASGTRFNTLSWGLDYSYRDVMSRDTGPGDTSYAYERADLSLGYPLTRKLRLIGTLGHEWVEYHSAAAAVNDRDDPSWSAGVSWAPSRRTSLEATAGKRFSNDTYYVSAKHRTHTSTWNLSYVEDLSDISQATLTQGTKYIWSCNGSPRPVETLFNIPPAPGCVLVASQSGLIPSLAGGLYISKTIQAGVSWGISKTTYSLQAFEVRRYFLRNASEDRSQGINASVSYRASPLTNLYSTLNLTRNEVPASLSGLGIGRVDDLYSFIVGVNHEFGRDLTGALTFRRYQRISNDPTADYTENSIAASANIGF